MVGKDGVIGASSAWTVKFRSAGRLSSRQVTVYLRGGRAQRRGSAKPHLAIEAYSP